MFRLPTVPPPKKKTGQHGTFREWDFCQAVLQALPPNLQAKSLADLTLFLATCSTCFGFGDFSHPRCDLPLCFVKTGGVHGRCTATTHDVVNATRSDFDDQVLGCQSIRGIMVDVREIIPKWPYNSGQWNMIIYPDQSKLLFDVIWRNVIGWITNSPFYIRREVVILST